MIKTISADGSHQNNMFYIWVFMVLVCRNLNIDPIEAISEGSLLIAAEKESSATIIESLEKKGISATVIGYITDNPDEKIIKRENGDLQRLRIPDEDPFWKVFFAD